MAVPEPVDFPGAPVLRRTVAATPEDVFAAFTDPATMQRWMGPGDVACIAVEANAVAGGRYRIHMRSEHGDHVAFGEYSEVVPGRRLVFTWSWASGSVRNTRVTVRFTPAPDGTEIELVHEKLPEQDAADKHATGWSASLDKLRRLLEE